MTDVDYNPGYKIKVHDNGWGVYLVLDIKKLDTLLVYTKDTWIGTFATKELADQYTDMMLGIKE